MGDNPWKSNHACIQLKRRWWIDSATFLELTHPSHVVKRVSQEFPLTKSVVGLIIWKTEFENNNYRSIDPSA